MRIVVVWVAAPINVAVDATRILNIYKSTKSKMFEGTTNEENGNPVVTIGVVKLVRIFSY